MIIDSHVHIGELGGFHMKPEHVIHSMEKYGVDYSLVSSGTAVEFDEQHGSLPEDWPYDQYSANLPTVEMARQYDGRIGVAVWCKPHTEGVNARLLRLLDEGCAYIKALKIHPYHSMMPVNAPQMQPYLRLAAERRIPMVVHSAGDEWSQPRYVYEAAKAFPDVTFVMVHMGLCTDNTQAIELIGSLPNLYGDTTWVRPEAALRLVKKYGAEKLLFGSDNPIDGEDTYAHPFYRTYFGAFKEWVTPEEYELIMHGNAERLFGLSISEKST